MKMKHSNNKYDRLMAMMSEIREKHDVSIVFPQSPITTPVHINDGWVIIDHVSLIVPPYAI